MSEDDEAPERLPRSFVVRQGRLTRGQRRALDELLPRYGLSGGEEPLDWGREFADQRPVALEVGVGSGEALLALAERYPDWGWVGVDVYPPGIGKLLRGIAERGLTNVRVHLGDAVLLLAERVPAASLDAGYIFFPDPWPKKRHHKRRLIQQPFLDIMAAALADRAPLHLATDWPDYAEWIREALEDHAGFANAHGRGQWAPRNPDRPPTRFEARGEAKGHPVFDLTYLREPRA
jgi:tRNA (guanine-N7-)-methyltransferase